MASNGAELPPPSTAPNPGLDGPFRPGTCEEEPNPFPEWISESGCPPGTRTGALAAWTLRRWWASR